MAKAYLVFSGGQWVRTNRLPTKKVAPPAAGQIKWLIDEWPEYVVCERKRIWRIPHLNAQGRRKTWREILLIEKNEGYHGVNFWRAGVRYYYSVKQLRRMLRRNPTYAPAAP